MNKEIFLKWGTIRGWDNLSNEDIKKLEKYDIDFPLTSIQRSNLCEFINSFDGKIYLDWVNGYVDKQQAILYINRYGKKELVS